MDQFCAIIAGEAPADIVYRDEHTIAFLDVRPVFKGHVLVCPIEHVDTLLDLPPRLFAPILAVTQKIASALPAAFGAQGSFVANNNIVSQSVPHLHFHVVPRTKGDGLRGFFWPRTKYAPGEAAQHAGLIREALHATE